jgi:hypothetical protein
MKLQIKHLASYLPYGLSVKEMHSGKIGYVNDVFQLSPDYDEDDLKITFDHSDGNHIWMLKPLLRPLSDLTKEIEVNGERFVPLQKLFDLPYERISTRYEPKNGWIIQYRVATEKGHGWIERLVPYKLDAIPLCMAKKLYEWHFDIHGLIPEGLAIDLNTVEK